MDRIINSNHTQRLMGLLKEEKEKEYSKLIIGGLDGCIAEVYIYIYIYLYYLYLYVFYVLFYCFYRKDIFLQLLFKLPSSLH